METEIASEFQIEEKWWGGLICLELLATRSDGLFCLQPGNGHGVCKICMYVYIYIYD